MVLCVKIMELDQETMGQKIIEQRVADDSLMLSPEPGRWAHGIRILQSTIK